MRSPAAGAAPVGPDDRAALVACAGWHPHAVADDAVDADARRRRRSHHPTGAMRTIAADAIDRRRAPGVDRSPSTAASASDVSQVVARRADVAERRRRTTNAATLPGIAAISCG